MRRYLYVVIPLIGEVTLFHLNAFLNRFESIKVPSLLNMNQLGNNPRLIRGRINYVICDHSTVLFAYIFYVNETQRYHITNARIFFNMMRIGSLEKVSILTRALRGELAEVVRDMLPCLGHFQDEITFNAHCLFNHNAESFFKTTLCIVCRDNQSDVKVFFNSGKYFEIFFNSYLSNHFTFSFSEITINLTNFLHKDIVLLNRVLSIYNWRRIKIGTNNTNFNKYIEILKFLKGNFTPTYPIVVCFPMIYKNTVITNYRRLESNEREEVMSLYLSKITEIIPRARLCNTSALCNICRYNKSCDGHYLAIL